MIQLCRDEATFYKWIDVKRISLALLSIQAANSHFANTHVCRTHKVKISWGTPETTMWNSGRQLTHYNHWLSQLDAVSRSRLANLRSRWLARIWAIIHSEIEIRSFFSSPNLALHWLVCTENIKFCWIEQIKLNFQSNVISFRGFILGTSTNTSIHATHTRITTGANASSYRQSHTQTDSGRHTTIFTRPNPNRMLIFDGVTAYFRSAYWFDSRKWHSQRKNQAHAIETRHTNTHTHRHPHHDEVLSRNSIMKITANGEPALNQIVNHSSWLGQLEPIEWHSAIYRPVITGIMSLCDFRTS